MLDTNVCIALIKRKPAQVLRSLRAIPIGDAGVSSVTVAELEFGVAKSLHTDANSAALEEFLLPLEIVLFDRDAAARYGPIRATLEKLGTPIGALDTMLAAHAIAINATLVTNHVRESTRVT